MPRKMSKDMMAMHGDHHGMHKGMGLKMLILGLLVAANSYWNVVDWGIFIGAMLAIGGICKMIMCGACCKK